MTTPIRRRRFCPVCQRVHRDVAQCDAAAQPATAHDNPQPSRHRNRT